MTTQTTTTPAPATIETIKHSPTGQTRSQLIAAWTKADQELATAQEAEAKAPKPSAARATARAQRLSAGARKANRRREITELEVQADLAGITGYEAWVEPEGARRATGGQRIDPAEMQATYRALQALLAKAPNTAKKRAYEQALGKLGRTAEARGVKLGS